MSTSTGVRAEYGSRLCDLLNSLNFIGLNFLKCKIIGDSFHFIGLL